MANMARPSATQAQRLRQGLLHTVLFCAIFVAAVLLASLLL